MLFGVNITIEDELLKGIPLSPREARIDLAVGLYADRWATLWTSGTHCQHFTAGIHAGTRATSSADELRCGRI